LSVHPLVVDLDGTLIKSDLLFETANDHLARHPLAFPSLLAWLWQGGKARLKAKLAEVVPFHPELVPYNEELVTWLRAQKAEGRTLVLATASHRLLADAVAGHLGIFDEVLATDESVNLKAEVKQDLLVRRYGEGGYDYVGNDSADLPVWRSARRAYAVSSSKSLIAKARSLGNLAQVFESGRPHAVKSLVRAMRPHQWLKNLLVLVPVFAAHTYGDWASLRGALLGFFVYGLTASSVYILNDLVDLPSDRKHARKRLRPFAAGNLSLPLGWLAAATLLLVAFGLASLALPTAFVGVLAFYFVLTLAYSYRLKQIALVDVLTLAGLYTLRIIAGARAASVPLSFWLLLFSVFFFLSLAFIKRFSELRGARKSGNEGQLGGRGYSAVDLEMISSMGISAGNIAVLVLALYIQDSHTTVLYRTPKFIWIACPLLLFWTSRMWLATHRGQMHDDPIVYAAKDKTTWGVAACFVGVFILARFAG